MRRHLTLVAALATALVYGMGGLDVIDGTLEVAALTAHILASVRQRLGDAPTGRRWRRALRSGRS